MITSHIYALAELEMHVLESGSGSPLLCLHGFPDHAGIWRRLMQHMPDTYHIIAPDQRGYHKTSRPIGKALYRTDMLVADMLSLMDALGYDTFAVCGNDWGGLVAFHLALNHPDRVSHLIAINAVHPYILQDMVWDDPAQRQALAYVGAFQTIPADDLFDGARQAQMLNDWYQPQVRDGHMSEDEVEEYRRAWSEPGVWDAMLNWYRAAELDVPAPGQPAPSARWTAGRSYRVAQPTLVLWGEQDRVFVRACATRLAHHAAQLETHFIADGGHTPQRSHAALCAQRIGAFLGRTV